MAQRNEVGRWWGKHAIAPEETMYWRIGPTELWITRWPREWRCQYRTGTDHLSDAVACQPGVAAPAAEELEIDRLAMRRTGDGIRLLPAMADRPLVVHPETRIRLPRGEKVDLFVSTPLWLRLETIDPKLAFVEFPLYRPSDTWFGPSPMEGELCYATRTAARLNPKNVEHRPHRVVSAVTISNRSTGQLVLEKIKLPLMSMSLFATTTGRLWTEKVTLEHREGPGQASLQLDRRPPSDVGAAELLVGPRAQPQRSVLIRAFAGAGVENEGS